jgi:hypothetical protein
MSNFREENLALLKTIDHAFSQKDMVHIEKEYFKIVSEILLINNPLHSTLIKKLNTLTLQSITKENLPLESNHKKRLKYKSKIDAENLDNIVNMSIWKNIPNVNTLFNNFESKKNSLVKSNLNSSYNMNKPKKNADQRLSEEDDDDSSSSQHNTYMSNSYYLKRKK